MFEVFKNRLVRSGTTTDTIDAVIVDRGTGYELSITVDRTNEVEVGPTSEQIVPINLTDENGDSIPGLPSSFTLRIAPGAQSTTGTIPLPNGLPVEVDAIARIERADQEEAAVVPLGWPNTLSGGLLSGSTVLNANMEGMQVVLFPEKGAWNGASWIPAATPGYYPNIDTIGIVVNGVIVRIIKVSDIQHSNFFPVWHGPLRDANSGRVITPLRPDEVGQNGGTEQDVNAWPALPPGTVVPPLGPAVPMN